MDREGFGHTGPLLQFLAAFDRLAIDVEHDDVAAVDADDLVAAGRNL